MDTDIQEFEDKTAAEILAEMAQPEIVERGGLMWVPEDDLCKKDLEKLTEEELTLLQDEINKKKSEKANDIFNISMQLEGKMQQLESDLFTIYGLIKERRMKGSNLIKRPVKNYKEKLDVILSKSVLPEHIMKTLDSEIQDSIRDYRDSSACNHKYQRSWLNLLLGYSINNNIYVHEKTKNRDPHIIIMKNRKSNSRIAGKIPREIVEGSIKREALGKDPSYNINDGKLSDISGIQLICTRPYSTTEKSIDMQKDSMTSLKYYFIQSKKIEVVELRDYYEDNSDYNAIHMKVKYNPQIEYHNEEPGIKHDFIEVQLLELNHFMNKEIGRLNQIRYAQQQEKFKDRKFKHEMKELGKQLEDIDPRHEEYMRKAKSQILEVLTAKESHDFERQYL